MQLERKRGHRVPVRLIPFRSRRGSNPTKRGVPARRPAAGGIRIAIGTTWAWLRWFPASSTRPDRSGTMNTKKIAVMMVLCAAVVLVACRREETYEPLKLGGPAAHRPAR
jgi:hypothetical protein